MSNENTKKLEAIPEQMSLASWNDVWFDRVEPVPQKKARMCKLHQTMHSYVHYNGEYYLVTAWAPPGVEAYVEVGKVGYKPAWVD